MGEILTFIPANLKQLLKGFRVAPFQGPCCPSTPCTELGGFCELLCEDGSLLNGNSTIWGIYSDFFFCWEQIQIKDSKMSITINLRTFSEIIGDFSMAPWSFRSSWHIRDQRKFFASFSNPDETLPAWLVYPEPSMPFGKLGVDCWIGSCQSYWPI